LDGVLVVALGERVLLEVAVRSRRRVAAVEADRLAPPVPRQPDLTPAGDVLRTAALPGLREDRVDLRERELLDRVVLVDEDADPVDGDANRGRLVPVLLLESIDLLGLHEAAHRPELRRPRDERGWGGRGSLPLDLDLDARIRGAERLRPERHGVVESV